MKFDSRTRLNDGTREIEISMGLVAFEIRFSQAFEGRVVDELRHLAESIEEAGE